MTAETFSLHHGIITNLVMSHQCMKEVISIETYLAGAGRDFVRETESAFSHTNFSELLLPKLYEIHIFGLKISMLYDL